MAVFEPKQINLFEINNGMRYEPRDGVNGDAINAPIEASAYAQEISQNALTMAEQALSKINDSVHGSVTISAYPIGSIFLSMNNTSPALLFGGTWLEIKDCFLWATGDTQSITYTENGTTVTKYLSVGEKGGEISHTLTVDEMPSHSHALGIDSTSDAFLPNGGTPLAVINNGLEETQTGTFSDRVPTSYGGEGYAIGYKGSGLSHNNMPPYLSVYAWQRVE